MAIPELPTYPLDSWFKKYERRNEFCKYILAQEEKERRNFNIQVTSPSEIERQREEETTEILEDQYSAERAVW